MKELVTLVQAALNLALNTLPPHKIFKVMTDYYENKAVFSSDDLIKRLALDLKQYELDLERNQLRHDCTAKYVNHLSAELES